MNQAAARIAEMMRRETVATKKEIADELGLSAYAIAQGIRKLGCLRSANKNNAYYVLPENVQFDEHGLWCWNEDVVFSTHGGMCDSIVVMVNDSPRGLSAAVVGERLHSNAAVVLSRLRTAGRVEIAYFGRQGIYVSTDEVRRTGQIEQQRKSRRPADVARKPAAPPGMELLVVVKTLVHIMANPEMSVASWARALQAAGVHVTAKEIRDMLCFYGIEGVLPKKRAANGKRASG